MNTNQVPKPAELPPASELLACYLGVVCFIVIWLPMPDFFLDIMLALNLTVTIVGCFIAFYVRQIGNFANLASLSPVLTLCRFSLAISLYRAILHKGMGMLHQNGNPHLLKEPWPVAGGIFSNFLEFSTNGFLPFGLAYCGMILAISVFIALACLCLMRARVNIAQQVLSQNQCPDDEKVEQQTILALRGGVLLLLAEVLVLIIISTGLIGGCEYLRHTFPEYAYTLRREWLGVVTLDYLRFLLVPVAVSAIPALFCSACFTLVALRPKGQEKSLGPACVEELQKHPYGLILAAAFLGLIGFSGLIGTGMPLWAFGPIAVGLGAIAFNVFLAQDVQAQRAEINQFRDQSKINTAQLQAFSEDYALVLELGSGLHQLAEPRQVQQRPGVPQYIAFKEQLLSPMPLWGFHKAFGALKERLFNELGYILPELRFLENQQLPLDAYQLKIYDKVVLQGVIEEDDRSESLLSLIEQMDAVIKTEVESLVSRQTVENMLKSLAISRPELAQQLQQQVGIGVFRSILVSLLKQGQSIRHLGSLGERILSVWETHESPDAETIARHLFES